MLKDKFIIFKDVKTEEEFYIPREKIIFFKVYNVKSDDQKRMVIFLEGNQKIIVKGDEYVEALFLNLTKSKLRLILEYYVFKIIEFFRRLKWRLLLKKNK